MKINGLDDPSLLVIFDKLTVDDLIRAGRVCSRWNFIRAKSASSRHLLTLLVGEHAQDRIDSSKLDNIPYRHLLTDDESDDGDGIPPMPERKCEKARNQIIRNDISSNEMLFIANLFSNVNNFTVSIQSETKTVLSLARLLRLWSTEPKLSTLKLYTYDRIGEFGYFGHQHCANVRPDLAKANNCLLSTINSVASIRVLIFDIDSVLVRVNGYDDVEDAEGLPSNQMRDYPIVKKLERLYLNSCYDFITYDLANSLIKYESQLKEIGINSEHIMEPNDPMMKISPEIARTFTQMSLYIESNIFLFSPFCAHFSNLSTLQLEIEKYGACSFESTQFFLPMASLTQLTCLTIRATISDFDMLRIDFADFNFNVHRNTSVKVLKLQVIANKLVDGRPGIFDALFLSTLFPNVQVFMFELIPAQSGVVVECDMIWLKQVLFWCTCGFRNMKMIQSINPIKEWVLKELE